MWFNVAGSTLVPLGSKRKYTEIVFPFVFWRLNDLIKDIRFKFSHQGSLQVCSDRNTWVGGSQTKNKKHTTQTLAASHLPLPWYRSFLSDVDFFQIQIFFFQILIFFFPDADLFSESDIFWDADTFSDTDLFSVVSSSWHHFTASGRRGPNGKKKNSLTCRPQTRTKVIFFKEA